MLLDKMPRARRNPKYPKMTPLAPTVSDPDGAVNQTPRPLNHDEAGNQQEATDTVQRNEETKDNKRKGIAEEMVVTHMHERCDDDVL